MSINQKRLQAIVLLAYGKVPQVNKNENLAMQTTEDIAEVLRSLADSPQRILAGTIRDINGNTVGECGIS